MGKPRPRKWVPYNFQREMYSYSVPRDRMPGSSRHIGRVIANRIYRIQRNLDAKHGFMKLIEDTTQKIMNI